MTADSSEFRMYIINNTVTEYSNQVLSGGILELLYNLVHHTTTHDSKITTSNTNTTVNKQTSLSTMRALVWISNNISKEGVCNDDASVITGQTVSQVMTWLRILVVFSQSPDQELLLEVYDTISNYIDVCCAISNTSASASTYNNTITTDASVSTAYMLLSLICESGLISHMCKSLVSTLEPLITNIIQYSKLNNIYVLPTNTHTELVHGIYVLCWYYHQELNVSIIPPSTTNNIMLYKQLTPTTSPITVLRHTIEADLKYVHKVMKCVLSYCNRCFVCLARYPDNVILQLMCKQILTRSSSLLPLLLSYYTLLPLTLKIEVIWLWCLILKYDPGFMM